MGSSLQAIAVTARLLSAVLLVGACGRSGGNSASSAPAEPAVEVGVTQPGELPAPAPAPAPPRVDFTLAEVGLDPGALDRAVDPCADFFQFSCGGWLAANPVDDKRVRWRRLDQLRQRNHDELVALLGAAPSADPVAARLSAFYAACMDEAGVEAAGTSAIAALLESARAVKDAASLARALAELHRHGIGAGFALAAAPDFKDGSTIILFLDSSGLGLPDRDYYLEGKKFVGARRSYEAHVARVFALLGAAKREAERAAADVIRVEIELARVSKGRTERRLIDKLYNRVDRDGLTALAPRFPWSEYFSALGHADLQAISVTTPRFFAGFSQQIGRLKYSAWSHYLQWQVVHATAATLPRAFVDEAGTLAALLGTAARPRAEQCVAATAAALGDELGQAYVKRHFAGNSRETAQLVVGAITAALRSELTEADWLSATARSAALAKAGEMVSLVGYPDSWSTNVFSIDAQSHAANSLRARAQRVGRELATVGKSRDRQRWGWNASSVNAGYSWLDNRTTVPAGMLQPPFFSARHSIPVNLGGLALIAGHEMSHGFDDQGARFDGGGRLNGWWQPDDESEFRRRSKCLVDQVSAAEAVPGVHVDGQLTLAENLADLAGVKLAYRAYRELRASAPDKVRADGFDEDQQFFIALGQAWCGHASAAETRRRLPVATQPPPRLRINGTLRNVAEFATAFSCAEGSQMRPANVCEIW